MMNFLDLTTMYENDTTITRENINQKLFEAPTLHGKYHKWLYRWRVKYIAVDKECKKLYREKYLFYRDEQNEVLSEKEIKWHVETDSEYIELASKVKMWKYEVEQIESMVKHCGFIGNFCKNIVDWELFMGGK